MVTLQDFQRDESIRRAKGLPPFHNRSDKLSVSEIITAFCDSPDECLEEINTRIARLEESLQRLRRVQKMLGGAGAGRRKPGVHFHNLDAKLLAQVEDCIIKGGVVRAKEVADRVGISYTIVGKIAAQSKRVRRRGDGAFEAV